MDLIRDASSRPLLDGSAPFSAIVDMGSFFSVVNWMAAAAAGESARVRVCVCVRQKARHRIGSLVNITK